MALYAFVDKIDPSPTILLHLDDENPLTVPEGVATPPPTRRVSSSGSSARNGDTIAQQSYNNRQISIPLEFVRKSTAEQQAEAIQKLGRLLDQPQWLMWQHDGNIEPVFFRVLYGDIDIEDEIGDETPERDLSLDLVAEPTAYGLPVTGSAVIANDPTAVTNPMSFVFPDVQGDVATPLALTTEVGGDPVSAAVIATNSGPSADAPLSQSAPTSIGSGVTGWTVTTGVSDADAIGGTTVQITKTAGFELSPMVYVKIPNIPPGDYRVIARARTTVSGATVGLVDGTDDYGLFETSQTRTLFNDGDYRYYDFGVRRAPFVDPQVEPLGLPASTTTDGRFSFFVSLTSGTVYLDHVFLVPAGLDDDVCSRLLLLAPVSNWGGITQVDSIASSVWVRSAIGWSQPINFVGGGFPAVVPGVPNKLTIAPKITSGASFVSEEDQQDDDKTDLIEVGYLYYPQYLYVRPATS